MAQLSGIVTCFSSLIPSEHNININCYSPMCKIYIKAFIWYCCEVQHLLAGYKSTLVQNVNNFESNVKLIAGIHISSDTPLLIIIS